MIGDIVTVTVDRPLGSYHPKYKDRACVHKKKVV